jgi:anti-sigma regulatory factor (Ser/Thr protein kinase)
MSAPLGPSGEIVRREEPHELRLDLPATHAHGRMGRRIARQFAESEGLPAGECDTLEFVVGELLDNAVDHGGGGAARELEDLAGDVRMGLVVSVLGNRWSVRIDDQGGGDPAEVAPLLDPRDGIPDLDDDRGRGLFLLAQLVDELQVGRSEDGLGLAFVATRHYEAAG